MAKTIDELKSAAAVVRDATEEKENTALRVGQLLVDMIETLSHLTSENIKGYVAIGNTTELPAEPTAEQRMKGYLLGTTLYVYVGTGGDTLGGKYQGADLQGPQGNPGVNLGDAEIVNDLVTGGATKVLSAEQGKVLNEDGYYFLPQKISNGNFTSTAGWTNSQYCTISANDNVLKAIPSNASSTINIRQTSMPTIAGHKYFVKSYVRSTKAINVFAGFTTDAVLNTPTVTLETNVWTCVTGYIITSSNTTNNGFRISAGMKLVSGEEHCVEVKEVTVVDLTAIFGDGNEPNDNFALAFLGDTWESKYKVTQKKLYDAMQEHKIDPLDMDLWFPLASGSYTPVTAVATVGYGFRQKGLEIHFIDPDGYSVKMKYKSSDLDNTSWNKLNNWDIESEAEKAGLTGGSIDFRGLGYSLPADNEDKVAYGDWYFEAFFEVLDGTGSNISLLTHTKVNTTVAQLLRFNQGYLQCQMESPQQFSIGASNFMQKAHHLFVRKNGDVYTTYVDGVQVSQVTMTLTKTYGEFQYFQNLSRLKLYMFRVGVTSADNDTQMLEHWNNGDVLGYKCNENDLVIDITRFAKYYVYDNVVGGAIPVSDGVVFELPAYPSEIVGAGAPATPPQYIGQRYYDTTNKRYYRAIGFSNVTDWKAFAYKDEVDAKQDALISGVTIKTINGTSILGAGNIDAGGGGGGGGSTNVVNVTDYGATGTGVTDDTAAIMQALEVARVSRLPLYFPANGGNCTYLTRKGLVLTTGMKVTADKGAILKNASAVLNDVNGNAGTGVCAVTTLTANAAQGAHSVVASTAGLAIGQEVTIINSNLPSYQETLADITAINGKTITIDTSRFTASADDEGVLYALTSGAYLTTDFSLIKTCIGMPAVDIEIENITLQACGNPDEPYIYTISPINQTRQAGTPDNAQKRIYIRDVTIDGSAQDGISTQGQSDVWIEDCIIKDVKYKGIHYGTSCDRVIIRGNYIYNCGENVSGDGNKNGGAGAIYFCVNNHRVLIEGNHIENCRRGVFGFDYRGSGETDTDSIVRGNTFTNCHVYGIALSGGYRMIVEGNIFRSFTGSAIPIYIENEGGGLQASVIANNVIGGFTSGYANTAGAIAINGAKQLVVSGNVVQSLSGATGSFDVIVKTSQKVALIGNVGSVDISDSGNSGCIKDNNIEN